MMQQYLQRDPVVGPSGNNSDGHAYNVRPLPTLLPSPQTRTTNFTSLILLPFMLF